ncbi:MAG: clostripain-related cysteine peptidase [Thermoplasmata archaeon]
MPTQLKAIVIAALVSVALIPQAALSANAESLSAIRSSNEDNLLLMMYMSADVPGAPLNWSDDLNEMEKGLINNNLTILALIDAEGNGDTRLYLVKEDRSNSDQIVSTEIQDPPFLTPDREANMGNPATLSDFARYCIEHHYQGGMIGLVIWGHGAGWAGVAIDKSDYLSCSELSQALREIDEELTAPLDLIVFDSCSMGSIEFLSELSGLATLAVTSEIAVPGSGFPYDEIFERISSNLPMSVSDIAFSFADEYVKVGSLMTDTTSQAAVIDLGKLGASLETTREFSEIARLFDPICRDLFNETRDASARDAATGSIDAIDYLSRIVESDDTPPKLARYAAAMRDVLSDSVQRNRVYISTADTGLISSGSLRGLTIYYPSVPVSLTAYRETGIAAECWSDFLAVVMSASSDQSPASDMHLVSRDLRYEDGLNDSFEFDWNDTAEILDWEFEIYPSGAVKPSMELTVNDSDERVVIDILEAGFYDIFAYGRDVSSRYLIWEGFEERIVARLMSIVIRIPATVDILGTQLKVMNLRTGETTLHQVEQHDVAMKLAVPDPNMIGDRLLVELCRNSTVIASGLLVLDGATAEVHLFAEPSLSPMIMFLTAISMAFLLAFALIELLRLGRKRERH